MRPERLLIEGLRSYRDQVEIDFSKLGLVAIIGDTGAGKSSIIEAMSLALYNRPSWDGRAVQKLRADNASAMRVVFTFSVAGPDGRQEWTVTRIHRSSSTPSVHKLECPAIGVKVDSERAINEQIVKLIGLTHDQYTRAIAIPQNQFARLLDATPGERTKILKSIFRLDSLTVVKDHADIMLRRYSGPVSERRGRRSMFPTDPAAAVADAAQEAARVAARSDDLSGAMTEATLASAAAKRAGERAAAVNARIEPVESARDPQRSAQVAAAAAAHASITREAELAVAERERAEVAKAEAQARAAVAITPFASRDVAVTAIETLNKNVERCEELVPRVEALRSREAALGDPTRAEQRDSAQSAAAAALAASAQLDAAARGAAAAFQAASESHATAVSALLGGRSALSKRETAIFDLRNALDTAVEANALAAVAGHCTAGDPCPVCDRDLPAGFEPPSDSGIDAARGALRDAESDLEILKGELAGLEARVAEAEAAVNLSRAAQEEAANEARAGQRAAEVLDREAESLTEAHDRELTSVAAEKVALGREEESLRRAVERLPEEFHVGLGDTAGTQLAIERITTAVGTQAEEIKLAEAADAAAKRAVETHARVMTRMDSEVRAPVAATREGNLVLAEKLASLLEVAPDVIASVPPDPGPTANPEPLTIWCDALDAAAEAAVTAATAIVLAANAEAAAETAAVDNICERVDAADFDDLRKLAVSATQTVALVQKAVTDAEASARQAASLDGFLEVGEPFVANLDVLSNTLTDGKFVRALVSERERELLVEASRKLRELTGDNFGFAESFKIVDRRSGQPRSTDTLSGGEQFLASLALALGLVEVAMRGGGQLDALFLDEGFGSLDAASLDQALATLGVLAVGGKLVALVSHLRRVAEHVDDVLLVERDDVIGSRVRLLDTEDRDHLLVDDARSGLTA